MKEISYIVAFTVMALLGSCGKADSNKKLGQWPAVEESLKAYAKSSQGKYYLKRGASYESIASANCGIIIHCDSEMLQSRSIKEELHGAVEGVIKALGGDVSWGTSGFPQLDTETGDVSVRADSGLAMRSEGWTYDENALIRVSGRLVSPRDDNGLGNYEEAWRSSKPLSEGTLMWLKIDYFNRDHKTK